MIRTASPRATDSDTGSVSAAEKLILRKLVPDTRFTIAVIGAGPAGLAAAAGAAAAGAESVLIIERDYRAGGILNQCIHDGFGLLRYREILTGPEYAEREIHSLKAFHSGKSSDRTIILALGTFVQTLQRNDTGDFILYCMNSGQFTTIQARSVIFAMGCRERTAGAISLPGTRPAGIMTAGTAQRLMNIQNITVGKRAVIIGSGDIGLIMARRLTLEGAEVAAVTEIKPFPGGLDRNIRQCLYDFDIPLHLSTGIMTIHGKKRVEGVTIASIGPDGSLEAATARFIPCDTVLLSVGLIPEHELVRDAGALIDAVTRGPVVNQNLMTSIPGLFACGNLLQVHDLVDYASKEAESAGRNAALYARGNIEIGKACPVNALAGIQYVLPQNIHSGGRIEFSLRVTAPEINFRIQFLPGARNKTLSTSPSPPPGQPPAAPLFSKKFARVSPSEMIRVTVSCPKAEPLEVSGEAE
jgi:NADPH-dependent 2,4-dienoyl-CoA reductase/sulfur reductase-like enzyme